MDGQISCFKIPCFSPYSCGEFILNSLSYKYYNDQRFLSSLSGGLILEPSAAVLNIFRIGLEKYLLTLQRPPDGFRYRTKSRPNSERLLRQNIFLTVSDRRHQFFHKILDYFDSWQKLRSFVLVDWRAKKVLNTTGYEMDLLSSSPVTSKARKTARGQSLNQKEQLPRFFFGLILFLPARFLEFFLFFS